MLFDFYKLEFYAGRTDRAVESYYRFDRNKFSWKGIRSSAILRTDTETAHIQTF